MDPTPTSIARLPGGTAHAAQLRTTEGALLHLILSEVTEELIPGVVVEVRTDAFVYFGEVRAVGGSDITVVVEHTLNLAQAKVFRERWQ